jgi:multicomponent Na+:H+ antiporter subunit E
MLILNVFLAVAWAAVTGQMTVSNLLAGFLIGYGVLWIVSRPAGQTAYFTKVGQVARLAVHFVWELLLATLRVAVDIVTPKHHMKPAILAIPVPSRSAGETTLLANVITLTPGTLSLDVSPDGKTLYVHAMYARDVEAARQAIEEGLGRRVHEVFE